ncbi:fumarylacetoacetate hydrolase family protein [Alkalihalobacillus hemicellulosilyticus]|uniref:Fumarylacetoacetate hydrolase family protein n=1 Tax=Halalkalibacter hemicellulosilyticusJCM 9152 TaxID=1236971 RepID=W4QEQ8_9BACI|nr:fumarylacetoacetate hydrolase family protein [Halalkalibacter hemicellulosilyticus]GAE29834.1 fumarylacetoacetate hydrolase family protein [Halalkalibacter hemicellulosilyticusJCM 9152]
MKLATIFYQETEQAAIVVEDGYILIKTINQYEQTQWPNKTFELITTEMIRDLISWYEQGGCQKLDRYDKVESDKAQLAPLYRKPRKIWGVGMNYLDEKPKHVSTYLDPVSFMKPDTTIIGMDDAVKIPKGSTNTTAEAELAIIIGKRCKEIDQEEASQYILGYTLALDMTEADIHAENHRYLTRAKSFDTFFSFGSCLLINEVEDVKQLRVATVLNGNVKYEKKVGHMRYDPAYIVAFHSKVMTLLPGDVILTGTPGAVVIRDGDVIEAHMTGTKPLVNAVEQL